MNSGLVAETKVAFERFFLARGFLAFAKEALDACMWSGRRGGGAGLEAKAGVLSSVPRKRNDTHFCW